MSSPHRAPVAPAVAQYRDAHPELIAQHPDFARWLEEEYEPIAGGWQY